TNIISPVISVITNISKDHTQFLGKNLTQIAGEKAGIIKTGIPCVIGEATDEIREVFEEKASEEGTTILFAEDIKPLQSCLASKDGGFECCSPICGCFHCELSGDYQKRNINTVLAALYEMQRIGVEISDDAIRRGMSEISELTGLAGRWMVVSRYPLTVCDTGHNEAGLRYTMEQLDRTAKDKGGQKHIVVGFVADKAIDDIIELLPRDAIYYLTQASIPRALSVAELNQKFLGHGIKGHCYSSPKEAAEAARENAEEADVIYIGGSTFIVADYLS
ncbi:MAG: bifunctional folylpolyglutamate synthase/dihydrofolate synthase, partial [Muribaculaceae bacterium]|nr:bifunctional folylpolyglutamate synthase/dihydrofolate synthase [Muribaculaceae bacterium]